MYESKSNDAIAIIDFGGQYCHLIARRLRDFGVRSDIFDHETLGGIEHYSGIVLSGGPRSVYDPTSPTINPRILELGVPLLGICYGYQLLARILGATVTSAKPEYGPTLLTVSRPSEIFYDTPPSFTVWMSHGDSVTALPKNVNALAQTARCPVAAFAVEGQPIYGVQFHPEVVHTEYGSQVLRNFALSICKVAERLSPSARVEHLKAKIREQVGEASVFFLVSGGVDSTVAFTLCAQALPRNRVLGLYVDTGMMRKGETEEFRANLVALGLEKRVFVYDASRDFLKHLSGVTEPEEKRRIIGRLFVEVQSTAMREHGIDSDHWLLGQGTIYPDTIESGGASGRAALIKTHHNRCDEIRELLAVGRVVEPLADFYKDEVRQLGAELGLSASLTSRWPFPGPGLAIRCLCSRSPFDENASRLDLDTEYQGYEAASLPVETVGVQGDTRTYRNVIAVRGPKPFDYDSLQKLSSRLCNLSTAHNRVVVHLAGSIEKLQDGVLKAGRWIDRDRLDLLREADYIARSTLEDAGLVDSVWQFPVVLIPISYGRGESVVLRPVNSHDGMTANFARLPWSIVSEIGNRIVDLDGIDAVFLDTTDKPPATIEWE